MRGAPPGHPASGAGLPAGLQKTFLQKVAFSPPALGETHLLFRIVLHAGHWVFQGSKQQAGQLGAGGGGGHVTQQITVPNIFTWGGTVPPHRVRGGSSFLGGGSFLGGERLGGAVESGYLASAEHAELRTVRLLCSQAFFWGLGSSIFLRIRRMVSAGSAPGRRPFLCKQVSRGQSRKSWQNPSESGGHGTAVSGARSHSGGSQTRPPAVAPAPGAEPGHCPPPPPRIHLHLPEGGEGGFANR